MDKLSDIIKKDNKLICEFHEYVQQRNENHKKMVEELDNLSINTTDKHLNDSLIDFVIQFNKFEEKLKTKENTVVNLIKHHFQHYKTQMDFRMSLIAFNNHTNTNFHQEIFEPRNYKEKLSNFNKINIEFISKVVSYNIID